jgi:hypothetical protein
VLTFASGDVRRVTYDDAPEQLDGWSRDGKWLYFFSNGHDLSAGMNDVYRVASEGGTPMAVSGDRYANEFFSAVSPTAGRWRCRRAATRRGSGGGTDTVTSTSGDLAADLTAADAPPPGAPSRTAAPRICGRCGRRRPVALLHVRSGRAGEHLAARHGRRFGAAPDHPVHRRPLLWPSATARADTIVFERNFRIWKSTRPAASPPRCRSRGWGARGPAVEHLRLHHQFQDLLAVA